MNLTFEAMSVRVCGSGSKFLRRYFNAPFSSCLTKIEVYEYEKKINLVRLNIRDKVKEDKDRQIHQPY